MFACVCVKEKLTALSVEPKQRINEGRKSLQFLLQEQTNSQRNYCFLFLQEIRLMLIRRNLNLRRKRHHRCSHMWLLHWLTRTVSQRRKSLVYAVSPQCANIDPETWSLPVPHRLQPQFIKQTNHFFFINYFLFSDDAYFSFSTGPT